jgi:hypothetical protein
MFLQNTTIRLLALAVIATVLCIPRALLAQEAETRVVNREYYLKAAFLLHFMTFTTWPDHVLGDDSIEVGILGEDPFGDALKTIEGKIVQGRRIIVKRSRNAKDLKSCAVLFISRSEKMKLREILAELDTRQVLLVSEIKGFAQRWGIINFTTVGNRTRFEINTKAAKRAQLRISSRLLRVAKVVDDWQRVSAGQ